MAGKDDAKRAYPEADRPCAVLAEVLGGELGRRHPLERAETLLGRLSTADVHVEDTSVSRRHASVVNNGKALLVRDLHSTTGTYVNEQLVDERQLFEGDVLRVGRATFRLLFVAPTPAPTPVTDTMTGLLGAEQILAELDGAVGLARRRGEQLSFALAGVVGLAAINQRHGTAAGDAVLRHAVRCVLGELGAGELLGRLRGSVFAVILSRHAGPDAFLRAQHMRAAAGEEPALHQGVPIPVDLAVGVGAMLGEDDGGGELLKATEGALSLARSGKNRIVLARRFALTTSRQELRLLAEEPFLRALREKPRACAFSVRPAQTGALAGAGLELAIEYEMRLAACEILDRGELAGYFGGGLVVVALPALSPDRAATVAHALIAAVAARWDKAGRPPLGLLAGGLVPIDDPQTVAERALAAPPL